MRGGFTVAALSIQSGEIGHDLEGILSLLCGENERLSSVPIAVLVQFSELPDPRYFKWVEEVNDPEVAKYRFYDGGEVCNRTRNISPSSVHLTKFLIAMFISIAQSIKSRFSTLPTDETDFTVVAMNPTRLYLHYSSILKMFLCLICGKFSHTIQRTCPQIDAFNPNDSWDSREPCRHVPILYVGE